MARVGRVAGAGEGDYRVANMVAKAERVKVKLVAEDMAEAEGTQGLEVAVELVEMEVATVARAEVANSGDLVEMVRVGSLGVQVGDMGAGVVLHHTRPQSCQQLRRRKTY